MQKQIFAATIALCAALAQAQASAAPAQAQASAAPAVEAALETVQVAGVRDPDFKTYRAFVRGLDTFEEKHAKLAPAAPLLFRLVAATPGATVGDVTMRIASDVTSLPVPINADGTFVMPRHQGAVDENADIFLNKKRGSYRWRPHFNTPNLAPNTRRLGDLRLECEVRWAVERAELSIIKRALIGAMGACNSKHVIVQHLAPKPLLEYWLVSGARRQKYVPAKNEAKIALQIYYVPLHDTSWPDDALVEFVYAPQA